MNPRQLITRTMKVIDSCTTVEQLEVARSYSLLAVNRMNKQSITIISKQPVYYFLVTTFNMLIHMRKQQL